MPNVYKLGNISSLDFWVNHIINDNKVSIFYVLEALAFRTLQTGTETPPPPSQGWLIPKDNDNCPRGTSSTCKPGSPPSTAPTFSFLHLSYTQGQLLDQLGQCL